MRKVRRHNMAPAKRHSRQEDTELEAANSVVAHLAKQKKKPRQTLGAADGDLAKRRLDRPSRRHKADGGPLPTTAFRRRQNEISAQDKNDAAFNRNMGSVTGLGTMANVALGDYPLAAGLALGTRYLQNRADIFDRQASDRDAAAAAIEDLINRSRGTDLRSRVYGPATPDDDSASGLASRKTGGKVKARCRR